MSIWNKFFGRKASAAGHIIVQNPMREHTPNRNYKALSEEAYRKNVIAKRCIDYIAAAVADIPLNLFTKRGDVEVTAHPILELLDRPNPVNCYEEYAKDLVSYFMLHGNMFSEAVFGTQSFKNPQELWVQRPDRMKVVPGPKALPVAYTLSNGGKKFKWEVDQITGVSPILHMKSFNPLDDWYGMSFVESAAFSVDQFNQSMIWNVSLLKNSARPSGAFVLEKSQDPNMAGLTENQRSQIRSEIEEIYTGSGNAGRPMLLEGGLNYQAMGLSPKDMDWIESKTTSTRDICVAFGVPSQLVGVPGDSTFANYEQARLAFYDNTAIPMAQLLAKGLTRWLTPMYDRADILELRPDIDSIEALAPRRKAKWDMVSQSTFLTTNEKRVETGFGVYEPAEDPADQIFINASLIPIDFAGDFGQDDLEDTEDVTGTNKPDDSEEAEGEGEKAIELKNFNLTSERKKRQFWAQQNRKLKRHETRMRNKVAAAFIKEGKQLARDIEGADPIVYNMIVDQVLEENEKVMGVAIGTSLDDVMRSFGKQVVEIGKSKLQPIEFKQFEDRFEGFLKNYIKTYTAQSVTNISNTTRKRLKNLFKKIAKEESEGSVVDISKQIEGLYKGFTPNRSLTIARTETHNAAMSSQLKTADNLQIPGMGKEWISSQDERARAGDKGANHVIMNGIVIPKEEKFQVPSGSGFDSMDSPGDPNAPAGQVINCRCVVAFVVKE